MKRIMVSLLVISPLLLAGCSLIPGTPQGADVSVQIPEMTKQPATTRSPSAAAATPGLVNVNYQSGITLTVNSPLDGSSVKVPTVVVSGRTVAGADVAVNDTDLVADAAGNFSTKVSLDEGENLIVVVANDQDGNSAEKDLTVTYNGPTDQ